jgi:hypothetical protein
MVISECGLAAAVYEHDSVCYCIQSITDNEALKGVHSS